MYSNAAVKTAYAMNARSGGTPQDQECAIIEQITSTLLFCAKNKAEDYVAFVEAIARNRKLWRVLGADVAEPGNKLPAPLKAQIFYLSEFVDHHSRLVLNKRETEDALIEINQMIVAGLQNQCAGL
ncbi:MAG: flagellar biosynthesis regulator FlaF [Dinoroseobacter sp.]|nr:flagellar biosynthesis regulator FlaF [Dinoroseobacter sp.]